MKSSHWQRVTIGLKKYRIYTVFPALIQIQSTALKIPIRKLHNQGSLLKGLLQVQALKFNFKDQSLIILVKDSTSLKFEKSVVSYAAPFP